MKKLISLSAILLVGVLFMTGCRGASVYNVIEAPISTTKKASDDKIFKAIKAGAYTRGWHVKKIKEGEAQASINVRGKHTAVVQITYNKNSYSINYLNSQNLKYNAEKNTIHKNYNSWVMNLNRAIQFELDSIE
jgi:L-cysteine desulfidase